MGGVPFFSKPASCSIRTVTETLSPVADLGQDQPAETNGASNGAENGSAEFDTLELRNR